ncbi:MAG: hypothetical protein V4757_06735 [Pseudomonadota bacterium]
MSIFKKVTTKIDAEILQKQEADKKVREEAQVKRVKFQMEWQEAIDKVALPLFNEFVADAKAEGYHAAVEQITAGNNDPAILIRLMPEKGVPLPPTATNQESVFQLLAKVQEGKVVFGSYPDQRAGASKTTKHEFGVPAINREVLSRNFEEFLDIAIRARLERAPRGH